MHIRYDCIDCDFQTLGNNDALKHKIEESHSFRKRMEYRCGEILYEWGIINQYPLKLTRPIGTKYITNRELLDKIFPI